MTQRQAGRSGSWFLLVVVMVPVMACGASGNQDSAPLAATSATPGLPAPLAADEMVGAFSRTSSYGSLAELRKASDVIAVITALDGATSLTKGGVPFTRTPIGVKATLVGALSPGAVVEQLGAVASDEGSGTTFEGQVLLRPKHQYLIFLRQQEIEGRVEAGVYNIVGVTAGLYEADPGDPATFRSQSPPEAPDRVPATLRARDVR